MTPPIIVDNKGDMLFFNTLEEAQASLEPIDVRNNEYVAYDSKGGRLELLITPPLTKGWLGRFLFPLERIELRDGVRNGATVNELKGKLRAYIASLGELKSDHFRGRLLTLIERAEQALRALE